MEEPKLAYIDYTHFGALMVIQLRENRIDVAGASSLDDFLSRHDLKEFPVLLFHPGVKQQHFVSKVMKDYPHLKVAFVTSPTSGGDYFGSDLLVFSYDSVKAIEEFVRKNQ